MIRARAGLRRLWLGHSRDRVRGSDPPAQLLVSSAEGEDDQNGSDGEAGGARPAACGDAWAVLLALPVLALPVLFHFEERRRVASARTHCEALCWQGENFFPGRDLLYRGENQLLLRSVRSSIDGDARPRGGDRRFAARRPVANRRCADSAH